VASLQPPAPPLSWDALPGLFPGFAASGRWLPLLVRHAALLAEAAPRVRVTSVPPAEAIRRHYAESLELFRLIRERSDADALADVGSGGGFPGLVAAAVEPGLVVHLVEPLKKRASLLSEMAVALGLANVRVYPLRAEEAGRGPLRDAVPIVTARAVADLSELLEYTAPLSATGGLLALPKGSALAAELVAAGPAMAALGVSSPEVVPMRPEVSTASAILFLRKHGLTPERFPRRPGVPGHRPL
jgi:16S rRNA (guanine527-N7)-methyltransferase